MPDFLPVSIAAKKLKCSDTKVRYLIKRGDLRAVKKGTLKVEKKSLEEYLRTNSDDKDERDSKG